MDFFKALINIGLFQANGAFLTLGSCFDMESHVRIGYGCDTEVLKKAYKSFGVCPNLKISGSI